MSSDNCIIISDEEEDNESLLDDSVQVLEHVKKNETITILDESIRPTEDTINPSSQTPTPTSSQPVVSTPPANQSQTSHSPFDGPSQDEEPMPPAPYSPPMFASSPSPSPPPSPLPPLPRQTPRSSSKKSKIIMRRSSPRVANSRPPPAKKPSPGVSTKPPKMDKLAREELRRQKQEQLQKEKLLKEANKANAGSKALQNCTTILDKNIFKIIKDEEETIFRTLFDESMLSYRVSEYPKVDNSIIWSYKRVEVEDDQCVSRFRDADWILVVMDGHEFFKRILAYQDDPDSKESIKSYICDIRRRSKNDVMLLVFNLNNILKSERQKRDKDYRKTFKNKFESNNSNGNNDNINNNNNQPDQISNIGMNEIENLRLEMGINLKQEHPEWKISIEFYEKPQDIVHTIVRKTCSIAKYEVKRKARTLTEFNWAISMDKEKACDPSKSREDLKKLWVTQLQQFTHVTLPVAKAIAEEYPSPSALLDQYNCLSKSEGEDLLAELYVQKNLRRQIGKTISRKIHCFMTCDDPDIHIGYNHEESKQSNTTS